METGRYAVHLSEVSSMRDLTDIIDEESMACCPLCDSPIRIWEPALVVSSNGRKTLAHLDCVDENKEYSEHVPD